MSSILYIIHIIVLNFILLRDEKKIEDSLIDGVREIK